MKYILKNIDTGKYVASAGSDNTYTSHQKDARVYRSEAAALEDACGNERAIPIHSHA
jgi:hypothetical protein